MSSDVPTPPDLKVGDTLTINGMQHVVTEVDGNQITAHPASQVGVCERPGCDRPSFRTSIAGPRLCEQHKPTKRNRWLEAEAARRRALDLPLQPVLDEVEAMRQSMLRHPSIVDESIPGWRGLESVPMDPMVFIDEDQPLVEQVQRQIREADGVRRPKFRVVFSEEERNTEIFMDGEKVGAVVAVRVVKRGGEFQYTDTYLVFRVKDAELVNLPSLGGPWSRLDVSMRSIPGFAAGIDGWLG